MKIYTKGMIGKKYKINYKTIDEWMLTLCAEWGSLGRYGAVHIPNDPYGRRGLPEYVVDAYPNVHPQPILYIIQSARPEDVDFFIQQAHQKLQLSLIEVTKKQISVSSYSHVLSYLKQGKSVAVNGNLMIPKVVRELVLLAIETGAKEILVRIKGHWEPEPYNVIEYDTAGNNEHFFMELDKKRKSTVV